MNETRRGELWDELNDRARALFDTATEDLLDGVEWVKSERYDMYTMLADQLTDEAIELVTRHRDEEIRGALESEELVGMIARMLWTQDDKPTAAPSSSYYMAARYNLDSIVKHIGLAEQEDA